MSKEKSDLFIVQDTDVDYIGYQYIYTIGVFSKLEPTNQIIYAGETGTGNRDWNYPAKVMKKVLELSHVSRPAHIIFKGDTIKKKLIELGERNPFKTTDLKTFRCIIEREFIIIFKTEEYNTQKREFPLNLLNAGYVLYVLSRKYKSISKCLDTMSKVSIYDFDRESRRFTICSDDTIEVVKIKTEINEISERVLKYIEENKFLCQGGYQHTDLIYSNDSVDIMLGSNISTPGPDYSFIGHLWNSGSSKDCLCLYKSNIDDKYLVVVDPSENGLGVDIRPWFDSIDKLFHIDRSVIDKIEEELLSIS